MDGIKDPPDINSGSSMEDWSDAAEMNVTKNPERVDNSASTSSSGNWTRGESQQQQNFTYTIQDSAPYRIYVELRNKDRRINKFSLGSMIRGMNEYRRYVTDMKYVGNNKILVFMSSFMKANQLMETLNEGEGLYKSYVPRHLVTVTGVISGIPPEIRDEEIEADIESEFPVVSVRRLTKMNGGERMPTTRVSVTFRAHELPKQVRIFCCRSSVRPFFQKVVICQNCLRFNHREQNCRGFRRCNKCTRQHETREEFENCNEEIKCANCKKTGHNTLDPGCPEKQRQEKIKNVMARKCVTYTEASDMFPVVVENLYERLSDSDEFPALEQSFANVTGNNYKWKNPLRDQWIKTNLERKAVQAAVKIAAEKEQADKNKKNVKRRRDMDSGASETHRTTTERNKIVSQGYNQKMNGTGLNNTFSVSEKERWETIIKDANAKAQAAVKVAEEKRQTELMSFYADFVGQVGSSEVAQKFKECTMKHFNLTRSVVYNQNSQ